MTQTITQSTQLEDVAIKAVYIHQYNSSKAARYVCSEVPSTSYDLALEVINRITKPTKKVVK